MEGLSTGTFVAFVLGALSPVLVRFGTLWLERKQRLQDRRDDFQRETLLALQDCFINVGRLTAQLHTYIENDWALGEQLSEARRLASLEAGKYVVRVVDERTRTLAGDYQATVERITTAAPDANHSALRQELVSSLDAVNDRIGELLRKL